MVLGRLKKLELYKQQYPALKMYLSSVVMRIPSYNEDEEEPGKVSRDPATTLACTVFAVILVACMYALGPFQTTGQNGAAICTSTRTTWTSTTRRVKLSVLRRELLTVSPSARQFG